MGVKILGKIKLYEIVKKVGTTSKEVMEVAKKLNIEFKNHMSGVTEQEAKMIEEKLEGNNIKANETEKKEEKTSKKADNDKKEEKAPVIIRREVIITEEKEPKEEVIKKEKKENIGFIERKKNKDFNIVYRNKPNKPKTVSELFGLNDKKQDSNEEKKVLKNIIKTKLQKEKYQA